MRLTRAVEYALRALRFLAVNEDGKWVSILEIADAEDVPPQFLAKVMQRLTRARVVLSACGKKGGYRIARSGSEIKLGDVVRAMEGPTALNACLTRPEGCRFHPFCGMTGIWAEMQAAMEAVLDKYTMADVVSKPLLPPVEGKRKVHRGSTAD